jgi:hypothetical protein
MSPVPAASGSPPGAAITAPDRTLRERRQMAEGFERMLVEQLATTMVRSALPEAMPYAETLPKVLTDAIVAGGGLGIGDAIVGEPPR